VFLWLMRGNGDDYSGCLNVLLTDIGVFY